jgi:hypothetical protein
MEAPMNQSQHWSITIQKKGENGYVESKMVQKCARRRAIRRFRDCRPCNWTNPSASRMLDAIGVAGRDLRAGE